MFVLQGPDGQYLVMVPGMRGFHHRDQGDYGGGGLETKQTVNSPAGRVTLIAQRSLAEVDDTTGNITDALLIGVPILVLLVGALAWYLAGRALRPVEAIRAEAAAITGSTMHRRVPEPGTNDEVGKLADDDERDARPARSGRPTGNASSCRTRPTSSAVP